VNNMGPFPFTGTPYKSFIVFLPSPAPGGGGSALRRPQLQTPIPGATINLMNKAIVTYASLDEMKDAEMREWQALPAHERLRAAAEMTHSCGLANEGTLTGCCPNSKNSCPSSTPEKLDI
jgi:hypothetical protein